MDTSVHKNCLKVQFGAQSKMPSDKEIFAFFRQRRWLPEMLHAMFREPREYSVYVKFQTEELMTAELLKCPASDEFRYANGDSVLVTFAAAKGNFKYVRLFGLPIEVDDCHMVNVISRYGKVHKVVRERYGTDTGYPILNGVRGVYLEIAKVMSAQVHVQNFATRIAYEGMERKCFSCGSIEHVKQDCPKRVSVNDRLKNASSFAGVLSGGVIGNQVKVPIQPSGNVSKEAEFPPLEELRQMFKSKSENSNVNQRQQSTSGAESSPNEQVASGVETQKEGIQPSSSKSELPSHDQVTQDAADVDETAMDSVDQHDSVRKRGYEERDSDATSESSGIIESPRLVQQPAELTAFKVPSVNSLLEKQVSATKLRTKTKKSKK